MTSTRNGLTVKGYWRKQQYHLTRFCATMAGRSGKFNLVETIGPL
jgi:hypothetical protein